MNWRRLFGFLLTDFFTDSPFEAELETKKRGDSSSLMSSPSLIVWLARYKGHEKNLGN